MGSLLPTFHYFRMNKEFFWNIQFSQLFLFLLLWKIYKISPAENSITSFSLILLMRTFFSVSCNSITVKTRMLILFLDYMHIAVYLLLKTLIDHNFQYIQLKSFTKLEKLFLYTLLRKTTNTTLLLFELADIHYPLFFVKLTLQNMQGNDDFESIITCLIW